MTEVVKKECSCPSCMYYRKCKTIEKKYGPLVLREKGNWREIYENSRRVGTPVRRCTEVIFKKNRDKFISKKVLEIGCGPLSEMNVAFCRRYNIDYYGIDPDRLPYTFIKPNSSFFRLWQHRIFSRLFKHVKKYRLNKQQCYIKDHFPSAILHDETFDLIYGNSTIEHWHEDEKDLHLSANLYKKDIQACYNSISYGGIILMLCPIYIHGNHLFMKGKIDIIEDIFKSVNWSKIIFEYWRRDYGDLMPYCPESRKVSFKKMFDIDLNNMWLLNVICER